MHMERHESPVRSTLFAGHEPEPNDPHPLTDAEWAEVSRFLVEHGEWEEDEFLEDRDNFYAVRFEHGVSTGGGLYDGDLYLVQESLFEQDG